MGQPLVKQGRTEEKKRSIAMLNNFAAEQSTTTRHVGFWRRVAWPALLVLLVLGFVEMSLSMATWAKASDAAALRLVHPATVSPQTADSTPAIALLSGTIAYVGWTGRDAAHHLNLMTYNSATQSFGPAITLGETSPLGQGPSLAFFPSRTPSNLYVAWQGTDNRLNVGRFNPSDPTHLANKVTLNEFAFNAPSIVAFNGRLCLSWRGTDGRLNIISSANGTTFNTKVTYSIAILTSPTLVATPFFLEIGWEEPSSHPINQTFIVIAQYNLANPGTLSVLVSTTQTSSLPVALDFAGVSGYPSLVVAWRTASDARIQLGFFNGTPVLSGIVTTAQTTPYGPGLARPLLSWTETDPLQHVNVSTENL
jgi:hypothetical protein